MNKLDQIEKALMDKDLDPKKFERCALDLLLELYPTLTPIPGGTDYGRDGDITTSDSSPPVRLLVTKSYTYKHIRANMVTGLASLAKNDLPVSKIVLANPGQLNATDRSNLEKGAKEYKVKIIANHGFGFFSSRLRRDGYWRKELLGLSADPIALAKAPWRLAESRWSELPLVGREAEINEIKTSESDLILVGSAGVGKTRLLTEFPGVAFADSDASVDQLVDDIRWLEPKILVIDDAARVMNQIRLVSNLRRQEEELRTVRLIAVCWPDEVDELIHEMPKAKVLTLDLLERLHIDQILKSMGVKAISVRSEIMNQAEGRPGWAVALADILYDSGWKDFLNGKSLLSQLDAWAGTLMVIQE